MLQVKVANRTKCEGREKSANVNVRLRLANQTSQFVVGFAFISRSDGDIWKKKLQNIRQVGFLHGLPLQY